MTFCWETKAKSNSPNVRTLNTLLRGCLWCAATCTDDNLVGGVVTSEIAWEKYKNLDIATEQQTRFDVSSYEYSITLLCQALRVEAAEKRISEMKLAFGLSDKKQALESSNDQSLMEGLAMAYCALARANTILKKEEQALGAINTSLEFAKASKDALKRGDSFSRKSLRVLIIVLLIILVLVVRNDFTETTLILFTILNACNRKTGLER